MSNITYKGGKEITRPRGKRGLNGWSLFFVGLAGFVLCLGTIFGGIAIAGTATPASRLISMLGLNPEDVLAIEYRNSSILSLVTSLMGKKFETLGDINAVTPMIEKTIVETINPVLEENLHYTFNWDEMKIKPFQESSSGRPATEVDPNETLGDYIPRSLKEGVTIASFVEGEIDGLLKYFLYESTEDPITGDITWGDAFTLNDLIEGGSTFFDDIVGKIKVGDVLPDGDDSPFLNQMKDWKISEFTDEKIKTLEVGLLFSDEEIEDNLLLQAIKNKHWTIDDLGDNDNVMSLKVGEVFNADAPDASALVKAIRDNTLQEMSTEGFIDTLYLKDVFNDPQGVLKALCEKTYLDEFDVEHYYTVGDLNNNDRVLELKVEEVFENLEEGNLLYSFKEKTLSEVSELDNNDVKISDVFTMSQINNNKFLKALYDQDPDGNATIADISNQDKINAIALEDIVDVGTNKVLIALTSDPINATIGSLSTSINSLKVSEIIDYEPGSFTERLMTSDALSDATIENIGEKFPLVTIGDIVDMTDPDTPYVLKSLKDTELQNLSEEMKDFKIKNVMEIYPGDLYHDTTGDKYYLRDHDEWKLLEGSTLTEELADYMGTDGYIAKEQAQLFEGSGTPTTIVGAKNRDTLYPVRDSDINDTDSLITSLKTNLTLGDVMDIDTSSPNVLQTLKSTKLTQIPTVLKTLKLSQIITIGSGASPLLTHLADVTVFGDTNNLEYALNNLQFNDVFTESDCSSGVLKALWDNNSSGAFPISEISTRVSSLPLVDIFGDQLYVDPTATPKKIKGAWWFLFTEQSEESYYASHPDEKYYVLHEGATYTMDDLGQLVTNMEYHMKNASLDDLVDADLISVGFDRSKVIDSTVPTYGGRTVGSLSLTEFFDIVSSFIGTISH